MTTANHLINALAGENKEEADNAFEAMIQDRISDFLEVRKVELASSIMDDLQEGEGMDAQRKYIRQGRRAIGIAKTADGKPRSTHTEKLKAHARKLRGKIGSGEMTGHADVVKGAVNANKKRRLQGEETIVEGEHTAAKELVMYADNDSHLYKTSHQPIVANLKKKVKKGIYDHEKATKLWGYHADRAAMKYAKEHGDGTPWHKMFTPADRKQAAKWFANGNKEEIHESLSEAVDPGSKAAATPTNAQLNRNILQNIRKAVSTLRLKDINPNMAAAGHRDFSKLVAKNPKAPGYMLLRKLAPGKAAAVQSLTQAGVPLGGSLEANPADFNQVVQRIKRFK